MPREVIDSELKFIKDNLNKMGNVEIAETLGRSRNTIGTQILKLKKLGYKRNEKFIKQLMNEGNKKGGYLTGGYNRKEIKFKRVNNSYSNLDDCWICISHDVGRDYPRVWKNGKIFLIHRYSYEKKYGSIPQGKFICHKCDNPSCINPKHLFLGNYKENALDMVRKGRSRNQYSKELVNA